MTALRGVEGRVRKPVCNLSVSSLSVAWEPAGDGKRVISLADNHLLLWDLQESSSQALVRQRVHSFGAFVFFNGIFQPSSECPSRFMYV